MDLAIVIVSTNEARWLRPCLRHFCRAIRTGAEPRSSGSLGAAVVRMIEAVDVSLSSCGNRVPLGDEAAIAA